MANLFLTNVCGRGCSFCFAQQGPWNEDYPARAVSREEAAEFAELSASSGPRSVSLLGGEPLLHPDYCEILQMLWAKGLSVRVFTSGSCPIPDGFHPAQLAGDLTFIVNVSPMDTYTPERRRNLDKFFQTFGEHASLSHTMLRPDATPAFLLDYITEYGLKPFIRVGIALPMLNKRNDHVLASQYRAIGLSFMDLARDAAERRIRLTMDCGFIACMFSADEIGLLFKLGTKVQFVCSPVVDVGPRLEAWHCFPLAGLPRISLRKCSSIAKGRMLFEKMTKGLAPSGIYPRCKRCIYREHGQCSGGCIALRVQDSDGIIDAARAACASLEADDRICLP